MLKVKSTEPTKLLSQKLHRAELVELTQGLYRAHSSLAGELLAHLQTVLGVTCKMDTLLERRVVLLHYLLNINAVRSACNFSNIMGEDLGGPSGIKSLSSSVTQQLLMIKVMTRICHLSAQGQLLLPLSTLEAGNLRCSYPFVIYSIVLWASGSCLLL